MFSMSSSAVESVLLSQCAGFNNVDLDKASELDISVARVPAYSPESVAEFAVGHILTLVRKYHKAHKRVSDGNFLLSGLVGYNLSGKTVGIIGTGKIGMITGKILSHGFDCNVLAYDPYPNPTVAATYGLNYTTLQDLLERSDIISLHCPLTPQTKHIINASSLAQTKPGVIIVNTSRGGLIDTRALIDALASGHVRAAGLDVYEREDMHFFQDNSTRVHTDDLLARLLGFHNVLITGHQAFLTEEALENIAVTTLSNLSALEKGHECPNVVAVTA